MSEYPVPPATATLRYVRLSPKKALRVVQHIRGRNAREALNLLHFMPQKAARILEKLLRSAMANAEHNLDYNPDKLVIVRVDVGRGYYLKRWRPRARGRTYMIRRPTTNLRIVLLPEEALSDGAES